MVGGLVTEPSFDACHRATQVLLLPNLHLPRPPPTRHYHGIQLRTYTGKMFTPRTTGWKTYACVSCAGTGCIRCDGLRQDATLVGGQVFVARYVQHMKPPVGRTVRVLQSSLRAGKAGGALITERKTEAAQKRRKRS